MLPNQEHADGVLRRMCIFIKQKKRKYKEKRSGWEGSCCHDVRWGPHRSEPGPNVLGKLPVEQRRQAKHLQCGFRRLFRQSFHQPHQELPRFCFVAVEESVVTDFSHVPQFFYRVCHFCTNPEPSRHAFRELGWKLRRFFLEKKKGCVGGTDMLIGRGSSERIKRCIIYRNIACIRCCNMSSR